MTKKRRTKGTVAERMELRKRAEFIKKVEGARWTAYFEQERRTCDSVVKKAVADATMQMLCIILDLPYEVPPVTMAEVARVEEQIPVHQEGGA